MDRKIIIPAIIIFFFLHGSVIAQAIFEPHYALKSPVTINLVSLEVRSTSTILNLSVENLVSGGYFCADNDTYMVDNNGKRYRMQKASGIPLCPDVHHFTRIGEMIYFTLTFPAMDTGVTWFDLVEECSDMCFSILGITSDPGLNNEMNKCFAAIDEGRMEDAASMFEALLPELEEVNHGLTGSLYVNLVIIYDSLNDPKAGIYRKKLEESDVPHKEKLIEGIK